MDEVPMRLWSSGFQSKEVRGAEKSLSCIRSMPYIFKIKFKGNLCIILDLPYL